MWLVGTTSYRDSLVCHELVGLTPAYNPGVPGCLPGRSGQQIELRLSDSTKYLEVAHDRFREKFTAFL